VLGVGLFGGGLGVVSLTAAHPGERHLVFAPARHVSQRLLDQMGLAVEFVPLPFALYRVERV
jgi:adenine-specific DNA-methyltransferase